MKEHEKLVQVYKPKDWQREVNRIISAGTRVASMVYNVWSWPDGRDNPGTCSGYTINLDDETITVEEL